MPPQVDARDQADEKVQDHYEDDVVDRAADLLSEQLSILVQEDAFRADQPEDRRRGADREAAVAHHQEREDVARKRAHPIQQQETPVAEVTLQARAEREQRVHVEQDVRRGGVQQGRREEAPHFARADEFIDARSVEFEIVHALDRAAPHRHAEQLQYVDHGCHADDRVGHVGDGDWQRDADRPGRRDRLRVQGWGGGSLVHRVTLRGLTR